MDNIILHFLHAVEWLITAINQIGSGTQTGKRIIPTPGGDIAYVRKFGLAFLETACTNLEDPIDVNCTFKCYAYDGTLLGSRVGGGAFVGGSTAPTAQGVYFDIEASGGDVTLNTFGAAYSATIGGTGYTFDIAAETIYDGDTLRLYLSQTESTYYDINLMYGGSRRLPSLNDPLRPYFHPYDAHAACADANDDGVEILDNKTYSFPYKDSGGTWRHELDMNLSLFSFYSSDGQDPIIKKVFGPNVNREVTDVFNNVNSVFFNENGTNVTTGAAGYEDTWHDPYGTIANAMTAAVNKGITNVIYGGTGAGGTGEEITEDIALTGLSIEPEYGYHFILKGWIHVTGDDAETFGFNVNGIGKALGIGYDADASPDDQISMNMEVYNSTKGFECHALIAGATNGTFQYNRIRNVSSNAFETTNGIAGTWYFQYNIIFNCAYGAVINDYSTMTVSDNFIYDNTVWGAHITDQAGILDFTRNIFFNNNIGLDWLNNWTGGSTVDNNIYVNNTIGINLCFNCALTIDHTLFYNNTTDKYHVGGAGGFTSTNEITSDPILAKITSPYRLGITSKSSGYRAGAGSEDIIPAIRLIEINADNIEINGIQFDGTDVNNCIYILDSANHIGTVIKWNNFFNYNGISVDLFDDDTNTNATISNNKFYNNGDSIRLAYGGNTVQENLIYNNLINGLYYDYLENNINHNVIFGNQCGICVGANGNEGIINCIIQNNNLGIYSEINISITYCCIPDATYQVDIADDSNFIDYANFINTTLGSEDFHLKITEKEYKFNSVGKNAADDGYDLGAYLETRTVQNDSRKMYQLANDPTTLDRKNMIKGLDRSEYIQGAISLYGKSHKKVLPLIWNGDEYSTEEQYDTLEYISSLIQTEENGINREKTKLRCLLLPDTHYETGASATIDAALKTITLASKSWTLNKYKGWWADIIFNSDSGNGTITAATKKLQVAPSPAWTVNQWVGYIFYHNYRYYYITANDADELTLSDPDDTLTNEASINWQIQQSFRITQNSETVLTILDPDSLLISGTYNFVIDFMECLLQESVFGGKQLRGFDFEEKEEMTGYALILQES